MFKLSQRWLWGLVASCLLATILFVVPTALAAQNLYGRGSYGNCTYTGCAPTQVTLPGGLQVSVNLHDGQVIPPDGYQIVVTPLNGQGTSFKQVDFYIDGQLIQSVTPDSNGTARWFWDPGKYPGTDVKVVVTGTDNTTATQDFKVTVGTASSSGTGDTTTGASPSIVSQILSAPGKAISGAASAVQSVAQSVAQGAASVVASLPKPVKYALPYFLFILLLIDGLLLLIQTRRELVAANKLQQLLDDEEQSSKLKKTFVVLVSHYLRTPSTVISGAVELLETQSVDPPELVTALKTDATNLRDRIESLVQDASSVEQAVPATKTAEVKKTAAWHRPMLYVPVILIGLVVFIFDYLAHHTGSYSVSQINLIVQIAIFASAITGLYLVFRRLELHRRNTRAANQLLAEQTAFNRERDELIAQAEENLAVVVAGLDMHIAQLKPSQAQGFIKQGQADLKTIMQKFAIAQQLKKGTSDQPFVSTNLQTILDQAMVPLQPAANSKQLKIKSNSDLAFETRNPELLAVVVSTVLDNAVAYSPAGGTITIEGKGKADKVLLAISDQGPGIPEEKSSALFQAFSKLDSTELFDHQGMGFSLYLDKLIMNYLVGDINVESGPGKGTTVTLSIAGGPITKH